jgi:hypothetical protein
MPRVATCAAGHTWETIEIVVGAIKLPSGTVADVYVLKPRQCPKCERLAIKYTRKAG